MIGPTQTTEYDVRFRLLGIPVRVHPLFWLVTACLGWNGPNIKATLIWIGCVFVSILVHEFGHGLTAKFFGDRPWILLYTMGGLCYSDPDRLTPAQRFAMIAAGPGAGFVLFGLVLAGANAAIGLTFFDVMSLFGFAEDPDLSLFLKLRRLDPNTTLILIDLLQINLFWGLLNLLPIFPMDGGQLLAIVLKNFNRRNGQRWTHIVSLLTGGFLAMYMFSRSDRYLAFLFALFALQNFMILQAMQQANSYRIDDDADWWKR